MRIPTNVVVTLDLRADDAASLAAGLQATAAALREGIEPNTVWGAGYCVGIRTLAGKAS